MENKPNYYAILSANVRYDKNITPNAKLLYAEITALSNMNGKCTASTDYFCNLYGVTKTAIQKWLKSLEDNNYITREVVYKKGSKQIDTRYITIVNYPTQQMLTTPTQQMLRDNINLTDSINNNNTYSNINYINICSNLSKIIEENYNIKTNHKGWYNDIRLLVERDKVSIERVNKALDWYSENIGGAYIPVIQSGKSLREKFIKLENAIKRQSFDNDEYVEPDYTDNPF